MKKARKKRPGIYKDVKPEPIDMMKPEGSAAFQEAAEKYATRLAAPVEELVSQMRESLVEWLKQSGCRISHSPEETQRLYQPGEWTSIIGDGRVVILPRRDYVPADDTEAARVKQWRDAAAMLIELFSIEHQCSSEPYNLAYIVRSAFNLGRKCERLNIRPFERLVGIGSEQVAQGETIKAARKKTAAEERAEKRREAEEAIRAAAYKHPNLADQKTVIQKKAAESLGIGLRALQARLKFSCAVT